MDNDLEQLIAEAHNIINNPKPVVDNPGLVDCLLITARRLDMAIELARRKQISSDHSLALAKWALESWEFLVETINSENAR